MLIFTFVPKNTTKDATLALFRVLCPETKRRKEERGREKEEEEYIYIYSREHRVENLPHERALPNVPSTPPSCVADRLQNAPSPVLAPAVRYGTQYKVV